MESENPLSALRQQTPDWRERLAEMLAPYVVFDDHGELEFLPFCDAQSSRNRVLIAVLALVAADDLGLRSGPVTPKAVESATAIPGGTVRRCLRELVASRVLVVRDGSYDASRPRLNQLQHLLAPKLEVS